MAAIDKTYTNSWDEYKEYRDWCIGKKFTCPNGDVIRPIDYLKDLTEEDFKSGHEISIMSTPCSLDYFLIKHCPIKLIHDTLHRQYSEDYIRSVLEGTSKYDSFTKEGKVGTRLRMTKWPSDMKANRPMGGGSWFVQLSNAGFHCDYDEEKDRWTWPDELHATNGWTSDTAYVKTIKALKRKIIKWQLPKGTIIRAMGKYVGDDYEFILTY